MAAQNRRRNEMVRLMLTAAEKQELQEAANKLDMPVSAFVRAMTLMMVRRGETLVTKVGKAA